MGDRLPCGNDGSRTTGGASWRAGRARSARAPNVHTRPRRRRRRRTLRTETRQRILASPSGVPCVGRGRGTRFAVRLAVCLGSSHLACSDDPIKHPHRLSARETRVERARPDRRDDAVHPGLAHGQRRGAARPRLPRSLPWLAVARARRPHPLEPRPPPRDTPPPTTRVRRCHPRSTAGGCGAGTGPQRSRFGSRRHP